MFDIGNDHQYFNDKSDEDTNNEKIAHKVATKSYRPMLRLLRDLLKHHPEFKCTFSFSGIALEQFQEFTPDVIDLIRDLVATGRVEILSETYYHSLASLYNTEEFLLQIELHRKLVKKLFGVVPTAFRNTELIYTNAIAETINAAGYAAILAEGWDHYLGWRSPNFLYHPPNNNEIKILTKNYRLSDDIAFRFSSRAWNEWPLTTEKFTQWVNAVNGNGHVVNLFMDFETFGEHQWEDTGIFDFMRHLPHALLQHSDNNFVTVTEAAVRYPAVGEYDVPYPLSWADTERDISAWVGNAMQSESLRELYALRDAVYASNNSDLLSDWRKLTTSDHFYYMCTKWFADGDVHKYFSPYGSPYDAYIAFQNVLHDVRYRIEAAQQPKLAARRKAVPRVNAPAEPKKRVVKAKKKTVTKRAVARK